VANKFLKAARAYRPSPRKWNIAVYSGVEHDISNTVAGRVRIIQRHRSGVRVENSDRRDAISIPIARDRLHPKTAKINGMGIILIFWADFMGGLLSRDEVG
jgi:hypothetical protein